MKVTIHRSRGRKRLAAPDASTARTRCWAPRTTSRSLMGEATFAHSRRVAPPQPAGDASVLFTDVRGQIPQPVPVEGHKALTRGVWRWTTIPGLVEVALYQALDTRGLKPGLWPDLDAYDLHVETGTGAHHEHVPHRSEGLHQPLLLAKKGAGRRGDSGGAQWLVVPDYRASSVPLLTTVCREFGLKSGDGRSDRRRWSAGRRECMGMRKKLAKNDVRSSRHWLWPRITFPHRDQTGR